MTLPSLDIEICSIALKKFSRLIEDKDNSIIAYGISADLPFAQNRWTVAEGVNNIILLSDYRSMDFARNWGLLMREVGLLASAVYVVDKSGKVTYCEILPEMGREPDYQRAIAAVETAK